MGLTKNLKWSKLLKVVLVTKCGHFRFKGVLVSALRVWIDKRGSSIIIIKYSRACGHKRLLVFPFLYVSLNAEWNVFRGCFIAGCKMFGARSRRYHLTPKSAAAGADQRRWKSVGRRFERARAAARQETRLILALRHIGRIIIKNRARKRRRELPAPMRLSGRAFPNVNKTHASSVKILDACLAKCEKEMSNLTNYTSPQHAYTRVRAQKVQSAVLSCVQSQKNPNTYHSPGSLVKREKSKWREAKFPAPASRAKEWKRKKSGKFLSF